MSDTWILGVSAFYHDSAACLVRNGEIVAAAQEERFSRRKGDESIPARAAAFCLAQGGIDVARLNAVAFYDKPLLKFDRLLETYLAIAPRGVRSFLQAAPLWSKQRLTLEPQLRAALGGYAGRMLFAEHHESHAASAFYPSPFEEAAVLTIDGVGEWATASIAHGEGGRLTVVQEQHFPDSLGLLYSAFTYHAGFRVNSGEYKLMGLAPYGEPRYVDAIYRHLQRVARHAPHHLLAHLLYGAREVHLALRERRLGHARGAAEQPAEAGVGHRQPAQVVEIALVEDE